MGALGGAGERRHQVWPILDRGQQLSLESGLLEVAGEVLDRGSLVTGWIDRVEADELLKDGGGLRLEVAGHDPESVTTSRMLRRNG